MVSYCAYSSHPSNPAQSFFTQPTPDASQSVTRDARFSLGAPPKNDPSKLAALHKEQPGSVLTCARTLFLFSPVGRWEPPASCEKCTAPLLRSLFGRWRDAMSEGPFGRSPGRTKLAEPSSSGTVRFHLSLKQWLHVQPPPLREHKDWPGCSRASIFFAMGFTNKGGVFNNNRI